MKRQFNIRIEEDLYEALKAEAVERDLNVSQIVTRKIKGEGSKPPPVTTDSEARAIKRIALAIAAGQVTLPGETLEQRIKAACLLLGINPETDPEVQEILKE
jgi:hypothetical protein